MAPKRTAREPTPSAAATTQTSTTAAGSVPSVPKTSYKSSSSNSQSPQEIVLGIWQSYLDTTPQRTKLIDVFMAFLVVVGVLQFVYCVIAGNYVCSSVLSWAEERNLGCVLMRCSLSMLSFRVSRRRLDSSF